MDKKFTYKQSNGRVTFRRGAFPEYTDEHLNRLETENEPVAAILKELNKLEEKNAPRPIFVSGANRSCGECPNCGSYVVDMDGEHYCSSCGQLIIGTTLKRSYKIEISSDCLISTNETTGERKEVYIADTNNVCEMRAAGDAVLENLIFDFRKAKKQTTNAAESGSEDDGK